MGKETKPVEKEVKESAIVPMPEFTVNEWGFMKDKVVEATIPATEAQAMMQLLTKLDQVGEHFISTGEATR